MLINLSLSCVYFVVFGCDLFEEQILIGVLELMNEGYVLVKIMVMWLIEFVCREDFVLNWCMLIFCNFYGFFDSFDFVCLYLLFVIIYKLYYVKWICVVQVQIWGDGEVWCEFMYVFDLVDVILCVLVDLGVFVLMNIGVGQDYVINDYYCIVVGVIGWQGDFSYDLIKFVGMCQKLLFVVCQM